MDLYGSLWEYHEKVLRIFLGGVRGHLQVVE